MVKYEEGHINKDWNTFKGCPNASKMWVHQQSVNRPNLEYKEGTFPRVWCQNDGGWCQVATEPDNCVVRGESDE